MNKWKNIKEKIFSSNELVAYIFMLPFLVCFLFFTVIPVFSSLGLSLTYFNVMEAPRWIGLENYMKLFLDDSLFVRALANTLVLSVVTGPVGFILCFSMAWIMNEFSPKVRAVLTLMLYVPSLGGAAGIWTIIFSGDRYGLLNSFLLSLELIDEPLQWLTDSTYMMGTAIAVILWGSLGTSFLSFVAGFQNMDTKLYEAAAIDGIRNRWQELWYITLPAMKPQMLFGAVMSITTSFGIGDVITGLFGYPTTDYALHTLVHHLSDYGGMRFEMGYASAIATILFAIMIIANEVVQKLLQKLGN